MYLRTRSTVCSNDKKQHNEVGTSEYAPIMNEAASVVSTEGPKETCNGEIFLMCVLGKYAKSDDMDDLSDFIECEQGKNQSSWLRERQRFRIWKYKKTIISKVEEKENVLESSKRVVNQDVVSFFHLPVHKCNRVDYDL